MRGLSFYIFLWVVFIVSSCSKSGAPSLPSKPGVDLGDNNTIKIKGDNNKVIIRQDSL